MLGNSHLRLRERESSETTTYACRLPRPGIDHWLLILAVGSSLLWVHRDDNRQDWFVPVIIDKGASMSLRMLRATTARQLEEHMRTYA